MSLDQKEAFEQKWAGKAGIRYGYGKGAVGQWYEDCTVKEVLWPGSTISNEAGEWVAFRLLLAYRDASGRRRQVITAAMPSDIAVAKAGA